MPTALRAAVGADAVTGQQIEVDGVRLAYDDEGSGPALLCLHSIAHGARDFAPLRERLRERCRVIALDWPGHGRSADDHQPASAARYVELLDGFVAALGLRGVVLLGNSIGGSAALRYASRHPELVRGLVLVDSAGLDKVDAATRAVTRAMAAFFAAGARGARWFPRAFDLYYRMLLTEQPARALRAHRRGCGRARAATGRSVAQLRRARVRRACPRRGSRVPGAGRVGEAGSRAAAASQHAVHRAHPESSRGALCRWACAVPRVPGRVRAGARGVSGRGMERFSARDRGRTVSRRA